MLYKTDNVLYNDMRCDVGRENCHRTVMKNPEV